MRKPAKCPACGSTRVRWNYDMMAKGGYKFKCINCGYTWAASSLNSEEQLRFDSALKKRKW